jgi:hypothetical protein
MPGSTSFPGALDTFPAIDATTQENGAGVEHDVVHANVHAAVSALQGRVGITGSTDATSLTARIAAVESGKVNTSLIGAANGVAGLDSGGKVPAAQLPSYVDDVLEYANAAALPTVGETGKIYVALDTNAQYRWSGSAYILLTASPGTTDAVPEGTSNLYFTASRVRAVVLTGLSTATNAAITATDSVLQAFGKLQAQISAVGGVWGTITGTLSAQTDLQAALDAKLDDSQLDTDGTLAANSDAKVASQKAVKTFVAASIAAGAYTDAAARAAVVIDSIADSDTDHAPSRNAVFDALALKLPTSYLDTDGTLSANSDTKIPSQKAVKTAIANAVTGLWDVKGSTDCSANPNYPSAVKGDAYVISVAGKIGGASGTSVDVGDVYVALLDNAGGTEASVGASWFHIEHNLVGVALQSGTLAQFAATTSAQLAGIISDETGSGALVFGTAPTLSNPIVGTQPAGDNSTKAASTAYVDAATAVAAGIPKVRAFSTAGTLAVDYENGDVVDGVTLVTGDRICRYSHSAASSNGIYTVNASGPPTRATDADTGTKLVGYTFIVTEGTAYAGTQWVCTNNPITLGVTTLDFVQVAVGGGQPTPTGTGIRHVTAGVEDTAAASIDGQSAAVSGDIKVVGPAIHAAPAISGLIDTDELGAWDAITTLLGKVTWAVVKSSLWSAWGTLVAAGTGKTTPVDADSFAISDSAASNATKTLTLANLKAVVAPIGRHAVPVQAGSMIPSTVGGCAVLAAVASGTNQPDIVTLDFDASTEEYAQFSIPMPVSWNEGTVSAVFRWSHASGASFGVVWGLQAVAVSDGDAIAAAFGTAQTVTDTGGTANTLYISPETSAITIAGTPAAKDTIYFRVYRKAADASDTLDADARLHSIVLYLTTDAAIDA